MSCGDWGMMWRRGDCGELIPPAHWRPDAPQAQAPEIDPRRMLDVQAAQAPGRLPSRPRSLVGQAPEGGWRRAVAGVALLVGLTACAHDNTVPPPPLAKPDPRICAPLEDPPPIQGGIVQPTTQEQVDAVTEFLRGEADLFSWGGRGWTRAGLARQNYCP
jgi:hypothetical protein